jgi:SPX domain protein involved in polyphosphate accumulation
LPGDDVEELVDESHEADPNSNDPSRGNNEIIEEVLKQVQMLIGHIDSMFVKDKLTPYMRSLSVIEEFALASDSSQEVGCDETTLVGKVALVFAAFAHDVS